MGFVKYYDTDTKYQGVSFTKSLVKKDGTIWESNEVSNYEMFGTDGVVVSAGDLVKSGDDQSLTFTVPKGDTTSLLGEYTLLVYLTDTGDSTINIIIAEYSLTFKEKKAN